MRVRSVLVASVVAFVAGCSAADDPGSPSAPSPTTDGGTPQDAAATTPKLGPPAASGGVLLEADGTLIPFGGSQVDLTGAMKWPGQDEARALWVLPDGSGGWTLDAHGDLRPFGKAWPLDSGFHKPASDVARALVILDDLKSGYVLDADGALHAFGGAPALASGWDAKGLARGLDLHWNAGKVDGGWVLDGYGGLHAFGAAADLGGAPPKYDGYDLWTSLHVVPGGAYVVGRYGILEPVGKPAGIPTKGFPDVKSADVVRDVFPLSPGGDADLGLALRCPSDGTYCGANGIDGAKNVLYTCSKAGVAPAAKVCGKGCFAAPPGTPDFCTGVLSCSSLQWWNTALTYGPYASNGWWDTDLAVSHDTPVVLRHDSKLYKTGVYGWGYMPEFVDQVTGYKFRYLHLRPQKQLATTVGQVYPAGTIVGYSGGDTADTGLGTYSTGAHLCVQTIEAYRTAFPTGKDPCE
jgi:hypothetical protein